MGIGDWGLGIGDWPNPQSPIPNPQSPFKTTKKWLIKIIFKLNMNKFNKFKINKELIYELIREIKDPEKDTTLEDLSIINEDNIYIEQINSYDSINIIWTPTTPHCSLALQIGLSIRHKLNIELKDLMGINYRFKLTLTVEKGKHLKENEINKQLNDKERYLAALENEDIVMYINSLINNKYNK